MTRAGLVAAVFAICLGWAAEAGAQGSARDSARAMAERGQQLLLAGRPAEALVELRNAEATFHAPTIVLLIARAHAELGQNEQAYREYTRVIDERLGPDAPAEWHEAKKIAAEERAALAPKVRTTNAGSSATGDDEALPWLISSLVAFGAGAAGMAVGIAQGLVASDLKDEIDASGLCRDGVCLAAAQPALDDATTAAHISTGMFVAGGVLLAAGGAFLTLYFVSADAEVGQIRANVGTSGLSFSATWAFQ